ncbi:hypothetical protein DDZ13_03320 [Coraliomargarita sinensis]|uniref:Uncharacterized protein n=1 Tax=Coraliomargarita sinensis TaxID=2174842 RepID=A0A317ZM49_9BACT|nr:hypothetical protein [Coraliomargarita sinensis]PXA05008.1 hypothetical protein DDZ13_03320 [Coraliomargarita sinensis]
MAIAATSAERQAGRRLPGKVLVLPGALTLILILSACQNKTAVDHRPSWVREAEARLQQKPSWQTSGPGLASGGGENTRSSFFGSGQQATSTSKEPPKQRSNPTPGVQWSNTQITVQVEE